MAKLRDVRADRTRISGRFQYTEIQRQSISNETKREQQVDDDGKTMTIIVRRVAVVTEGD